MKYITLLLITIFFIMSHVLYSNSIPILNSSSTRNNSMAGLSFLTSRDSSSVFNNASTILNLEKNNNIQATYKLTPMLENDGNITYSHKRENWFHPGQARIKRSGYVKPGPSNSDECVSTHFLQ